MPCSPENKERWNRHVGTGSGQSIHICYENQCEEVAQKSNEQRSKPTKTKLARVVYYNTFAEAETAVAEACRSTERSRGSKYTQSLCRSSAETLVHIRIGVERNRQMVLNTAQMR